VDEREIRCERFDPDGAVFFPTNRFFVFFGKGAPAQASHGQRGQPHGRRLEAYDEAHQRPVLDLEFATCVSALNGTRWGRGRIWLADESGDELPDEPLGHKRDRRARGERVYKNEPGVLAAKLPQ
jgi:hypothetical protein